MGGRNYNDRMRDAAEARYAPIPLCPSVDLDERCALPMGHGGEYHRHRSGRTWPVDRREP